MKLAVFSDVHGNLQGLKAVLKVIKERGADLIWCGGDLVGYGANPGEVIALVQRRGIPTIMGNYDDGIGYGRIACGCDYADESAMARGQRSIAWTQGKTTAAQKAFLRNLPHRLQREIEGYQVVLVHGSPARLNEYLLESLPEEVFLEHLVSTQADILLFGHTHKPFHRVLKGKHLVNTGSAGKPKHGNPNATFALLDITQAGVKVEIVQVPYDYESAAQAIEATDLPHEFAQMLRTGQG